MDVYKKLLHQNFKQRNMFPQVNLVLFLIVSPYLLVCYPEKYPSRETSASETLKKISFDISLLSSAGLIGPPDGLRSLSYEFCIPASTKYILEVKKIDQTIQYYLNTPGRIGCDYNQYLCIANTHKSNWKATLFALASLPYIDRIDQSFAE
jgi:hypothetical protein